MKWLVVFLYYSTFISATPHVNSLRDILTFPFEGTEPLTGGKTVTSSSIEAHTKYGRLVLYVHKDKSVPTRQNLMKWVRSYNNRKKHQGVDDIVFSPYYYKNTVDFINETGIDTFPNLIYFIGDHYEVFNEDVTNEIRVNSWFEKLDEVVVLQPQDRRSLDQIMSSTKNCSNTYLMIGDRSGCDIESWSNIARVLHRYGIQTVKLKLPLEIMSHISLYRRLSYLDENSCEFAVLLHKNNFTVFEDNISPKNIEKWVKSWMLDANDAKYCPIMPDYLQTEIKPELTELEDIYFTSEVESAKKNKRIEFILVGLTGGLAVIVLAYSIFWGLNGSAFAKS
ncbi:unnamed protein product [Caenorhabditis angaria]|uniref:Uncharacterized protein n=1 Tax=Caenorhabditis angaria TaxID=860376 RepID=A0A9P1IYT4_9PELO|nr:unnamed protein product [Caenorhabditis angaria]